MLTAKGKYSLKALAHLATLDPRATTQAVDIAKTNGIPKKFLDAILGELRNAGIVQSQKGPGGGYRLARIPSEIKIGLVIRTIDGPLAPIARVGQGHQRARFVDPDLVRASGDHCRGVE